MSGLVNKCLFVRACSFNQNPNGVEAGIMLGHMGLCQHVPSSPYTDQVA